MGESQDKSLDAREETEKSVVDSATPSLSALRPKRALDDLPERYITREADDRRYVVCREAPNVRVYVERGLSVSASTAVKSDAGTIFLDGVAQSPPFLDSERDVFNLDHHEGCVRLFTLSTCEQAYILIRKGLNLGEREWEILANEPDLDTVLAIWLLLNHKRVAETKEEEDIRQNLVPLVRLEGLIDVHGMSLVEMSCLPAGPLEETKNRIEKLREQEVELKRKGRWGDIDFSEYTAGVLQAIDRMIYSPWHFTDFQIVDEFSRIEIGEKKIAVICRSELGIYEAEQQLLALHDKRLGIIVLQKTDTDYSLKQVDLFLPTNLQRVYSLLNLMDRVVTDKNRWGGSDMIGGSPRLTGTALQPEEIAEAIASVFQRPTATQILSRLTVASIATLACLIGGWTLTLFWAQPTQAFLIGFSLFAVVSLLIFAQPYRRMYGIRMPVGRDWAFLFGFAILGTALGGSWFPARSEVENLVNGPSFAPLLLLLLPLSAELLFRGVIHGLLAERLLSQRARGVWFLSWPLTLSTLFYLGVSWLEIIPRETDLLSLPWLPASENISGAVLNLIGLLIFGLACGMARERSESLVAPILFHWLAVGILAAWMLS